MFSVLRVIAWFFCVQDASCHRPALPCVFFLFFRSSWNTRMKETVLTTARAAGESTAWTKEEFIIVVFILSGVKVFFCCCLLLPKAQKKRFFINFGSHSKYKKILNKQCCLFSFLDSFEEIAFFGSFLRFGMWSNSCW